MLDINGDNYNDVLTLAEDKKHFRIHVFDDYTYSYKSKFYYNLGTSTCLISSVKVLPGIPTLLVFVCTEDPNDTYLAFG